MNDKRRTMWYLMIMAGLLQSAMLVFSPGFAWAQDDAAQIVDRLVAVVEGVPVLE